MLVSAQISGSLIFSNSTGYIPPWEADSSSASLDIPPVVCEFSVHYCYQTTTAHHLPQTWARYVNSADPLPSYFYKIHFNILLLSTPRSSMWCLYFRFSHRIWIFFFSPYLQHAQSTLSPSFDHPNIWRRVKIMKLIVLKCSSALCYTVPVTP